MKYLFTFSNVRRGFSVTLAVVLMVGIVSSSFMPLHKAYAAVQSSSATPKISFTFDDGLQSALTIAQPTLAKYGLNGTDYVISGCVGMTTAPNTCNANNDATYMTWSQVKALAADGWEIGDHTVDHVCLASSAQTDPSDCANPAPLTTAQVDAEFADSQSAILANTGISPTDFAPPYGDYNNNVMAQAAKYFSSMRQFKNAATNANVWPYSDYYLQDYVVQETTTPVSAVETAIDNAITSNQWLILTFHDIAATPSTNPDDYQYGTSELDQIAAYVQSKESAGLSSVTINQGLESSSINFLNNGTFKDGIADGWTTDNPTAVTHDTGDNGAVPDPTDSIKLTSSATAAHLFSPKVAVDSTKTYGIKSFLNVQSITSGEVGYYIDEYDANGTWISGQYKTAETSSFVEDMNFNYTPSSANVKQAALQIYTVANSGVTAYVSNVQWFALDGSGPTTVVTPPPVTPPPVTPPPVIPPVTPPPVIPPVTPPPVTPPPVIPPLASVGTGTSNGSDIRVGALTSTGAYIVKGSDLSNSFITEYGSGVSQGVQSGSLTAVVVGGDLYVKQGGLGSPWVAEAGAVASAQVSDVSGSNPMLIGYLDTSGNYWVKQGGISSPWAEEYEGVAAGYVSGNRVAVLTTSGAYLVKDGGAYGSWVTEYGSGVSQGDISGDLIGMTIGGNLYVKQGDLGASWVDEYGGVASAQLSDATGLTPLRIGVIDTSGNFLVKEGDLGSPWVSEYSGVSQGVLSGNLIGILVGGTYYVKQGDLGAPWINQDAGTVVAGELWSN